MDKGPSFLLRSINSIVSHPKGPITKHEHKQATKSDPFYKKANEA